MANDSPGVQPLPRRRGMAQRARGADQLPSSFEEMTSDLGRFLREQTQQRPYVTVAVAAGVGYVLGGGVPRRFVGVLLGLGSRYAVQMFMRELVGAGPGVADAPQRSVS